MLPYLIPFIITFLCAIRYDINNRKDVGKKIGYAFLYVYLTLLIGLRYHVGGDSFTYEAVYGNIGDLNDWKFTFKHIYQPGFTFIMYFSRSISTDFVCFQLIHSFIFNTLLFIFIHKQSKYIFLSLFLIEISTYIGFATEVLREVLAVLVFAFNYPNYKSRKWIKYYIGVFISILFHISASALLILPFLRFIEFNKKFLFTCLGTVIVIPLFFKLFSTYTGNLIADKVDDYAGEFYGIRATFNYVFAGGILPLFFLLLQRKKRKEIRFENLICIQTLFGLASIANPIIFGRIVNYFVLFFMLSLADYFHRSIRSRYKVIRRNSYIVAVVFVFAFGIRYTYLNKYIKYIPYSSVISPVDYNRDYYKK